MPAPDIITYRYQGILAYVVPAKEYEQGIAFAKDVFPALAKADHASIVICVNGIVGGQRKLIRISPMVWSSVVSTLARFEVLDILLKLPEIVVDNVALLTDPDALPTYEDVRDDKSSADYFLAPSRVPSTNHKSVPLPEFRRAASRTSRSHSRSPSPTSPTSSIMSDLTKALCGKRTT